jgi:LysM repeat protein
MPKQLPIFLSFLFLALTVSGCASSKDVKLRAYLENKPRLDQEVTGKLGNWQNSPDVVAEEHKTTRKIYVVEFSKEPKINDVSAEQLIQESKDRAHEQLKMEAPQEERAETQAAVQEEKPLVIPDFEGTDQEDSGPYEHEAVSGGEKSAGTGATSYVIKKDDTLQKISKEVYGTYSKWTKIYEANKDVIPDPNRIKPGLTIQIPQE